MNESGKIKNILVATDFSENARLAAIYAAELARHHKARLIIFHAFYPFFIWDDASSPDADDETGWFPDPEAVAQQQLDKLAKDLYAEYQISVTRLIKPGFAADEIPALALSLKADLVITGARGTDLQEDKVFGEVSSDLLSETSFPYICFPASASGTPSEQTAFLLRNKKLYCNVSGFSLLKVLEKEMKSKDAGAWKVV